jgi:hypothetical protein
MLIKFDPTKVRFQNVKIKRVTTALGGSMSVLDEAHFEKTGKEVFHKVNIPMSLARMFKVKYKITQFMVPHEGVIMYYDDMVISIEKATTNERFAESFDGVIRKWTSNCETYYADASQQYFKDNPVDWYFDGLYVYNFHGEDLKGLVKRSKWLDAHGKFRAIPVQSLHFTHLNFKPTEERTRMCVAAVVSDDVFSVSAPIWTSLGEKATRTADVDDDDGGKTSLISSFKGIDTHVAVNLNFALRAARELADQFGYEAIQPLQLPKMMIQLKTVNVPRLPKEVKSTTDIGLKFTHGLSWLLGLQYNATDPKQLLVIRQMIKYLMTKGYFWKEKTKKSRILVNESLPEIPLLSLEDVELCPEV